MCKKQMGGEEMIRSERATGADLPSRMRLGIVVERRESRHPWGASHWRPVAVLPGGSDETSQRCLDESASRQRWFAGNLDLEVFRGETGGYRDNLSGGSPRVYVVLRPSEDGDGIESFLATACPHEAQAYLDSGEEIVEGIAMPDEVVAWLQAFIDRHHVEETFVKRKQKPKKASAKHDPFWREPPVARGGR